MDDVWKDLSLSSLNHHTTAAIGTGSTSISGTAQPPVSELDFQDFLSGPLDQVHRSGSDQQESITVSIPRIKKTRATAASGHGTDENSRDRKRIRLMKNRESAARSRARKQAYTYELELEVAHLLEENARLKQQQEKVNLIFFRSNQDLRRASTIVNISSKYLWTHCSTTLIKYLTSPLSHVSR